MNITNQCYFTCFLQDLSAHVMYRLTRARLYANLLGFSVDDSDNAKYRYALKEELTLLKNEYDTLLYGGRMVLQVCCEQL